MPELMRQRLVGLALAVIAARKQRHHSGRDGRPPASGVVNRYRNDVAAAVEMIRSFCCCAVGTRGKVCGLVMLHDSVMTVTNNDGVHVHFGWRSNPLGEWGLALWQDGHEPARTWEDPLPATDVVDEIIQRLELDDEATSISVNVQSLGSLFSN